MTPDPHQVEVAAFTCSQLSQTYCRVAAVRFCFRTTSGRASRSGPQLAGTRLARPVLIGLSTSVGGAGIWYYRDLIMAFLDF